MQISRLPIVSFFAVAFPVMAASSAVAADGIGSAVGLTPSVTGSSSGELSVGSTVYQDEVIRSGAGGTAQLLLRDNTRLSVGSNSTVKLDKFVYAGGQKASSVVLGLAKGTFRFVTGASAKKAYRIDTPLASIGVRGTILSISVSKKKVSVTLHEGAADVCVRGRGCTALEKIGQTLTVDAGGRVINPAKGGTGVKGTSHAVKPVTSSGRRPRGL